MSDRRRCPHNFIGEMFAGKPTGQIGHCAHCGCTRAQAHELDPILYPLPEGEYGGASTEAHPPDVKPEESFVGTPSPASGLENEPPLSFIEFKLPPQANTHIHFGDPPGDFIYNFYRIKPFTKFQVRMIGWCFGWRVTQE